jgi:hypothetical protein
LELEDQQVPPVVMVALVVRLHLSLVPLQSLQHLVEVVAEDAQVVVPEEHPREPEEIAVPVQ